MSNYGTKNNKNNLYHIGANDTINSVIAIHIFYLSLELLMAA